MTDYYAKTELVCGAALAWEAHLGSHFCKVAAGTGECEAGSEILRRLHAAEAMLAPEERRRALDAIRACDDWEERAPYPRDV